MNPQEINRRIAIACGVEPVLEAWWAKKDDSICMSAPTKKEVQDWIDKLPEGSWAKDYVATPFYRYPNYHGDLNAMHEAENFLKDNFKEGDYWFFLRDILGFPEAEGDWDRYYFFSAIHATAAQRAEAFLRTSGQWEEGE